MIPVSPLLFIIVSTIAIWELYLNILIKGDQEPDILYEILRELMCLGLFYSIPSLLPFIHIDILYIIGLTISVATGIILLISFLALQTRNFDYLFPLILIVSIAGFIISEYSLLIGILLLPILKVLNREFINKDWLRIVWEEILKYKFITIIFVLNTLTLILILWGYL